MYTYSIEMFKMNLQRPRAPTQPQTKTQNNIQVQVLSPSVFAGGMVSRVVSANVTCGSCGK
jgi:hypothetical protein